MMCSNAEYWEDIYREFLNSFLCREFWRSFFEEQGLGAAYVWVPPKQKENNVSGRELVIVERT